MPTWQPNWSDVVFDYAGAEAAIHECRLARDHLQNRDVALAGPLARARDQWRGPKRVSFDETEAALAREVRNLIEELRSAEHGLTSDIARAQQEQAARVRARAQWFEELREEQEQEGRVRENRLRESSNNVVDTRR